MQIFNTFFNANLDFSLFYSYISSFSLNYFVLFADLIETSIPQLLNYVGYSTNPNPQRLITNKTIVDLIIDESDIVFFSSYKYMNYSVFSDSFVRNLISAANGESFFHNNLEAVLSMLNISFNYIGIGLSVLYLILVFFFFYFILYFILPNTTTTVRYGVVFTFTWLFVWVGRSWKRSRRSRRHFIAFIFNPFCVYWLVFFTFTTPSYKHFKSLYWLYNYTFFLLYYRITPY